MGFFSKIFGKGDKDSVKSNQELSAEEINVYVKIGLFGTKLAEASKRLRKVSNPTEARRVLNDLGKIIENEEFAQLCQIAANTMSDDQLLPICRQISDTSAAQAITFLNYSKEGLEKS